MSLHVPQRDISNAKGNDMDNPEYTERLINEALKARTDLPITVGWDGNYLDGDDTANFEIYFDLNETDLVLWDYGNDISIVERVGPSRYASVDYARTPTVLAKKIVALIEEEIASGKLGEEA